MMKKNNVLFLTITCIFLIFIQGCKEKKHDSEKNKKSNLTLLAHLKIGLIPEQNVLKQKKRYEPLGEYIERKTGLKIKFTILPRYGNIIENFNKLKLDGAFWGSFTGAMAIKKLGVEHIARPVNLDGTSSYRGYIFVHKKSNIRNVKQMRNRVIAFVDRATTAGYVYPMAYFRDKGIKNINRFFKEIYFTGSHDAAIYAVYNREADIGCAKNTIFDMVVNKDEKIKNNLVILDTSDDVPSNGLGLKKGIKPFIKKKLKDVLLNMDKTDEGLNILKKFQVIKFIETTEKDYQPVFEFAKKAGIDLENYRYINK